MTDRCHHTHSVVSELEDADADGDGKPKIKALECVSIQWPPGGSRGQRYPAQEEEEEEDENEEGRKRKRIRKKRRRGRR